MVVTPVLRGLFGIEVDAASNTITVNPRLPAGWEKASIRNLRVGSDLYSIQIRREKGMLYVSVSSQNGPSGHSSKINLRSDLEGAKVFHYPGDPNPLSSDESMLSIPLPGLELVYPPFTLNASIQPSREAVESYHKSTLGSFAFMPKHALPIPGSRPSQVKILSTTYDLHSMSVRLAAPSGTFAGFLVRQNQKLVPKIGKPGVLRKNDDAHISMVGSALGNLDSPVMLEVNFPKGESWQTVEVTLSW